MRRAVLSCLIAYVLGILAFEKLSAAALMYAVLLVVMGVLFRFIISPKNTGKLPLFIAGFFVFGVLYTSYSAYLHTDLPDAGYVSDGRVIGRISEVSDTENEYYDRYVLEAESITIGGTEVKCNQRFDLSLKKYKQKHSVKELSCGDVISVGAKIKEISAPLNRGDADYRSSKKAEGIFCSLTDSYDNTYFIGSEINYFSPFDLARIAREYFSGVINTYFSDDEAGILRGILLSDKTGFSNGFYQKLKDSGMVHIAVASGMHVNCVLAVIFWVLFSLRVRKRYTYLISIGFLCLFAFLQGLTPSIIRAVIMAAILLIGGLISRDYDRKNALYITVFLMLLYDPYMIYSIGLQLSFASVLGILLFASPVDTYLVRIIRVKKLSSLISVTAAAQIFILPILAFYFGKVSVYSVIASVLIVPFMTVVIALGFMLFAVSWIGAPVGAAVAFVLGLFVKYINGVIYFVSMLPFSTVDIFEVNIRKAAIYYLLLALIYQLLMKRSRIRVFTTAGICIFTAACILISNIYLASFLRVTFINVGQGDAALIQIPGGKTVVIDGGGSSPVSKRDIGEELFVPYLKRRGVNTIDYAVVSHFDKDHAQGIAAAVRLMKVRNIVLPYRPDNEKLFYKNEIENLAKRKGINVLYFKEGDELSVGDAKFTAYAPTERMADSKYFEENNKSLVLKLEYGETSFLFTGDIKTEAEFGLAEYGDKIRADVLKIPHHGSKKSSSARFIKTSAPKYAIISEGKDNIYGFPARETIDTLINSGADIYQTSECGDIIFYVGRGGIWQIDTYYKRPDYEKTFLKSGERIWLNCPQLMDYTI